MTKKLLALILTSCLTAAGLQAFPNNATRIKARQTWKPDIILRAGATLNSPNYDTGPNKAENSLVQGAFAAAGIHWKNHEVTLETGITQWEQKTTSILMTTETGIPIATVTIKPKNRQTPIFINYQTTFPFKKIKLQIGAAAGVIQETWKTPLAFEPVDSNLVEPEYSRGHRTLWQPAAAINAGISWPLGNQCSLEAGLRGIYQRTKKHTEMPNGVNLEYHKTWHSRTLFYLAITFQPFQPLRISPSGTNSRNAG
jgi:hypothetical protein